MRSLRRIRGPISGLLVLSVPLLALFSLNEHSSASQTGVSVHASAVSTSDMLSDSPAAFEATDSLSDWKYTGNTVKSKKSKKSPKSKKSGKSGKSNKKPGNTKKPK